jgi:KaiC/GvpD/RAD55 family RecA-like ATPase
MEMESVMEKELRLAMNAFFESTAVPTLEEVLALVEKVKKAYPDDPEGSHGATDSIEDELLRRLGYGAAVDVIDSMTRWIA